MKNKLVLSTLFSGLLLSSCFSQAEISLSVGYMHTKMSNSDSARDYFGEDLSTSLNGVNLKAGFSSENIGLGVMTSFSYSAKTTDRHYRASNGHRYKEKLKQSYSSILVGPSFNVADIATPYVLVGAAFSDNSYNYDDRWGYYDDDDDTRSAFVYGLGVQVHPFSFGRSNSTSVLLDLSFERAYFKNNPTNSFVVGAGLRF